MNGLLFMLMEILRLALILQSPAIILGFLIWIINLPRHPKIKKYTPAVSTYPHILKQIKWLFSIFFESMSEYIFWIIFTTICLSLQAALHCACIRFVSLIWWYRFTYNLINDTDGRYFHDILKEPRCSQDPELSGRHSRIIKK